jgi:hypothetical protein
VVETLSEGDEVRAAEVLGMALTETVEVYDGECVGEEVREEDVAIE